MKIIQLIDTLSIGGAERMAVNIANVLSNEGIHNSLICTRSKGALIKFLPINTRCISLNKKSSFDLIAFRRLLCLVKKEKHTVLHAHSTSIYWAIVLKIFLPKLRVIWHDHNGNRKFERNRILKIFLNFSNAVAVVNQDLLEWMNKELPRKSAFLIVNFPFLKIANTVKSEEFIILQLANLRHPKGHETMIEAVKILEQRSSLNYKIWFVGNDYSDEYSERVKRKINEYGLEDKILIKGAIENTAEILGQVRMGVLSSDSEGLPVSLLEYGLAKLPVVVTDVGQCSMVLDRGKLGVIVPKGNPILLADAIEWHILNPTESMEMGILLHEKIKLKFGEKSFLRSYFELLDSI